MMAEIVSRRATRMIEPMMMIVMWARIGTVCVGPMIGLRKS